MKAAEEVAKTKTYEFGEYRLEAESLSLFREKNLVQLPPKTIEVLLAVVESGGRVVTREEITERVWAETFVEEANLTHHVSALRKTLGENGNGRQYIETIPRRGYRFVAEVREIAAGGAAEITVSERTTARLVEQEIEIADAPPVEKFVAQPTALETPAPSPATAQKSPKRRRSAALVGAIALVAFAVVGFAFYKFLNPAPLQFEAKTTTRLTSSGRVERAAISPDGKFIIYSQEEHDGRQSLWIQHIGSESSAQIAAPAKTEYHDLKIAPNGKSLYYVADQGTLYQMEILGGMARKIVDGLMLMSKRGNISISHDGKQIAFVRLFEKDKTALLLINADGTNERTLATFEQSARLHPGIEWSPDGKVITCKFLQPDRFNIFAVQVVDGTNTPILPLGLSVSEAVWMPDSKSLLITAGNGKEKRIWQIPYPNGEAREITTDTNLYKDISISADGRSLTGIKYEQVAHIWRMPSDDSTQARQLTAGFEKCEGTGGLGWLPDGRIIYDSCYVANVQFGIVEADNNSKELVKFGGVSAVSPDGRFVVYVKSDSKGNRGLWRMNLSDGSEKQLTIGVEVHPTFSPDGKWILFVRFGEQTALWKVSVEGGKAQMILHEDALCPAVSPDGKTVAFVLRRAGQPNRIALMPFDGGKIIKTFDAKLETNPVSNKQKLQWTPDGRAINFISLNDGVSNIWRQPIDGSAPVQVTNFKEDRIFNFAFSADGSQLALSRGTFNSDVVLIENQK